MKRILNKSAIILAMTAIFVCCKKPKLDLSEYLNKTDEIRIKCRNSSKPESTFTDKKLIDTLTHIYNLTASTEMPSNHMEYSQIDYFCKGKYLFTSYYTDRGLHYLFKNTHYMATLPTQIENIFVKFCR